MDDLPQLKGRWMSSQAYLEVTAAERWRIPPSQFRDLSVEDQAEMMAKVRVDAKRDAVDAAFQEHQSRKRGVGGRKGSRAKK